MENFINYIDWDLISEKLQSQEVYEKFQNYINWNIIKEKNILSLNLINKYCNNLKIKCTCKCQCKILISPFRYMY